MSLFGFLKSKLGPASTPTTAEEPLLINAYATVRDLPRLNFLHELNAGRDLSDPELATHLDGLTGYVMSRGDGTMTAARYHLWRHVQRTRNHVSFTVAADLLGEVEAWARSANAVMFLPDGSVRAPDMAVLIDAGGQTDPAAALPYPADAVERRQRTLRRLDGVEPKPPASMPPGLGESEVVLRPAPKVMKRAMALFYAAAHAEEPGCFPAREENNPIGHASLSPAERDFVGSARDEARASAMTWRYEAMNALLWALAIGDARLDDSTTQMKVVDAWTAVNAYNTETSLTALRLRPTSEILDALDRTWLEHWIARQAGFNGVAAPTLNHDIVMERHRALNWLTGFHNPIGTEWDNIDCPT